MGVSPQNDQALRHSVVSYLTSKLPPELTVFDGVPAHLSAYLPEPGENYWVVPVPALNGRGGRLGSSRYLFVSKRTGMVVSDQFLGE